MKVENSQGKIWYALHMYRGVAEYRELNAEPYRVLLSENTLRRMDPSFAGRPVFVFHVDEVNQNINDLRKDADGWVTESFFNEADGNHWSKIVSVSDRAEQAIADGWAVSNCYIPTDFGPGGIWNGVDYDREILGGEYEHLAIVPNPRYQESVILSPEQFKIYNESKKDELMRLANDNNEGKKMKLNFFKKAKVENSIDLESMSVQLPKSGKEVSITALVNQADELETSKGVAKVANSADFVEIDGEKVTVADLVEKYKNAKDAEKADKEDEKKENEEDEIDEEDLEEMANEEDEKEKEKKEDKKENKKKNEGDKQKVHPKAVELFKTDSRHEDKKTNSGFSFMDGMTRGKSRYGSGK